MRKHLIWPALLGAMALAAPAYGSAVIRPFSVEGGMNVVKGTEQQKAAWWCEMAAPGATRSVLTCSMSRGSLLVGTGLDGKPPYNLSYDSGVHEMALGPVTFCYSGVAYYDDGTSKSSPQTCVTRG